MTTTPADRLARSVGLIAAVADTDPALRPALRRRVTRQDPLAFALTYLAHHFTTAEVGDRVTLGWPHLMILDIIEDWWRPRSGEPRADRHAIFAPRGSGKSTWAFLAVPLWMAAHGHARFAVCFSSTGPQAKTHLETLRREMDGRNELLAADFPDLCRPAMRPTKRLSIADRTDMIERANGAVFVARGADSDTLGLKLGNLRPDLIILDDLEPQEATYSPFQAEKRRSTLIDTILPLNEAARVLLVGTVTMPGSIAHQLVQFHDAGGPSEDADNTWVAEQRFDVHVADPIIDGPDGRDSCWPEKWPIEYLLEIEGTRDFAKNFANRPVPPESAFWRPELLAPPPEPPDPETFGTTVLAVDPAVTGRTISDFTGWAVATRTADRSGIWVRAAGRTKRVGVGLIPVLARVVADYDVDVVLVESNQGGDLWRDLLADLGVPVRLETVSAPKPVRWERALRLYERGVVRHANRIPAADAEMLAVPNVRHDDVVDAVTLAVLALANKLDRRTQPVRRSSYV
ncbi:MAG: hypothetical protein D6683_04000 [Actinomyces sp.]|nr:MAG: hypothetical protein D6683_04000 [Actinomyces sp.]